MPDWAIKIARVEGKVTFSPNPQKVFPGDNISWKNDDSEAHWPGQSINGVVEEESFMLYQIPAGGTSTAFSVPSSISSAAITYGCSLHPGEEGSIEAITSLEPEPKKGAFAPEPEPEAKKSAFAGEPEPEPKNSAFAGKDTYSSD